MNEKKTAESFAEKSAKDVPDVKIKDLSLQSKSVNLTANVVKMDNPREITTRLGRTLVANAELEDDTDKIKLVLWGEQTQLCAEGDTVRVENAFVKEWNGEKQLSLGRFGKLKKIN